MQRKQHAYELGLRQQELARDNARADERLGFDRDRFYSEQDERRRISEMDRGAASIGDPQVANAARPDAPSLAAPYETPPASLWMQSVGVPQPGAQPGAPQAVPQEAAAAVSRREQLESQLERARRQYSSSGSDKSRAGYQKEIDRLEKQLQIPTALETKSGKIEEEMPGLETSVYNLKRARELSDKAGDKGALNSVDIFMGKNLPGFLTNDTEKASYNMNKILQGEAIDLLKKFGGSDSNKELDLAIRIGADPSTSLKERNIILDQAIKKAEGAIQNKRDIQEDIRNRDPVGTAARKRAQSPAAQTTQDEPLFTGKNGAKVLRRLD